MKKFHFLIIPILLFTVSVYVFASSPFDTSYMLATRSRTMGGVGVAFMDNAAAMRLNPATLNKINTISIVAEGSFAFDTVKNLADLLYNKSAVTNLKGAFDSRVDGFIGFSTNRFGLGLATSYTVKKQDNKAQIYTFSTSNVALALPLGIFSKSLDKAFIGANIKLHHPTLEELDLSVEPVKKSRTRGNGQGFDLGLLLDFGRVRLGLSAMDLSTSISFDGESKPVVISPHFDFGTTIDVFYRRNPGLSLIAVDYTDVFLTKGDFNGVLRVGTEQRLFKNIKLRSGVAITGIMQGTKTFEYSTGLGVKLGPVVLDAAVTSKNLSRENLEGSVGFEIRL